MILLYDGTFEGFLSLVYEVYYKKLKPTKIYKTLPNEIIFEEILEINSSKESGIKVLNAIKTKFPKEILEKILNIFMCDSKKFEMALLEYIVIGFKDSKQLYNINNSCVFYLNNLEKELFRVTHKLTGFIRFKELEDKTLYAKIESKFNVVYFLGRHFLKRFNNQNFIIHDINRKLAFVKIENDFSVQEVAFFDEPNYSSNEEKFQKLWKSFFSGVTINERTNLKLQTQMVPLLYRTYMSEFKN
ncbi:TIGR03915 family putative DNA repair protein [Aliarcobacter cryaerophilus]|uniref:TIGR03915 family putative DNA repair protein n=2 Tax=unclassified Arcobacter TaxID=2593671 RepID=A0AA96DA43_9BACT|nr:TIGR03915 family putative DNA repair protein [Arcobacter sp. AZ-2023]WPD09852.1 TIGR03915 family putative DNA repair protein [Arcobacter sp. DSM 115954]WNL14683.1 TIGR03915 family putative DNA repair protein [Arcobacter sp. AZ-2023]WNL19434.1 TIGR03915 family putative DNA repair protein [Arcobacter sp. AZ-2023]WNL21573.1 TIGR03915 family putative DNA repair protein [Arcobacter sp. AZ-2023]